MILILAQVLFQKPTQHVEKFQPFGIRHTLRQGACQGVIGDFLKVDYQCVHIGFPIQSKPHEAVIFFHKTMGVRCHVCYRSFPGHHRSPEGNGQCLTILMTPSPPREEKPRRLVTLMTLRCDYFTSTDGLSIRWGYAAANVSPARGTVLFLNGRTEYMEKYAEVFEELTERHFTVYSLDWRGQGLSDRLLPDSQKGHVNDFEDYLRDLEQLMAIAHHHGGSPPYILLGHSMGGHLALRFLERHLDQFARGILTAPMIDIQIPKLLPRRLLRWLAAAVMRRGRSDQYAIGSGGYGARDRRFEGNPLTSDRVRFQRNVDLIARDPRLALGGVTYGWLSAALQSIDYLNAPVFARTLAVPLLIVTAAEDRIVSRCAQKAFCRRAPDCRQVLIEGARHELLVETDPRRDQFWQAFDRFVAG